MTFASLRASVEGSTLIDGKEYVFPYSTIPNLGNFIKARVVSITENQATLDNGGTVNFDFCLVAVGASNRMGVFAQPVGNTISERKAELQANAACIEAAQNIVIIGAGATGIEMAGEIVERFAGKKVTLISSSSSLCEGDPQSVGQAVTQFLLKHKVVLKTGVKATVDAEETKVTLSNGEVLTADLVLNCVGSKPNTDWIKETALAKALDAAGRLTVDDFFRVEGFKNIFSIGDCSSVKDKKMGHFAHVEATHLGRNFQLLLKNPDAPLKPYKIGGPIGFYNLGKGAGTGSIGSCVFPSCMVAMVKSKDLLVGKIRGDLGVKN